MQSVDVEPRKNRWISHFSVTLTVALNVHDELRQLDAENTSIDTGTTQ
jgi:hypothetical protein